MCYIRWEGLFVKRVNMKGLFGKGVIMGGVSLANRGKMGGFWAKSPSLSSPHAGKQGRGRRIAGDA